MDEERFEPQDEDQPIELTPLEREDIAADLEDLSAMRGVFQAQGVKGVVINCQDCGENIELPFNTEVLCGCNHAWRSAEEGLFIRFNSDEVDEGQS